MDPDDRRYALELWLEELCLEWEAIGIDTTNIHRGIDEFRDPLGTAEHLVRTGAEGFHTARTKLGPEKTIEAGLVEFADIADPAVVEIARRRLDQTKAQ